MTNERLYLMNGIELLSNGKYTYKDLKFKRTETLEKILKELKGKNKMTNETIEKIAKVIDDLPCITKTHCDVVKCENCEFGKSEYYCGNVRIAKAIYTEIVEPLEKENKDYYDQNCNLQLYIDNHEEIWSRNEKQTRKELEHKAEVLERALKLCIEDCLDDTTPFISNSEYYIQQAEKELQGETE